MKMKKVVVSVALLGIITIISLMLIFEPNTYDDPVVCQFVERCGRGQNKHEAQPWLLPEEAVSIYSAYHEKGGLLDDCSVLEARFVFIDLDFDGVLELVSVDRQGSALCYYYAIFSIDRKTKQVIGVERDCERKVGELLDFGWQPNELTLVEDIETGDRQYLVRGSCSDSSREDLLCECIGCGAIMRNGRFGISASWIITSERIWGRYYKSKYYINDVEVSKAAYHESWVTFGKRHYNLHVIVGEMHCPEIELRGDELRKAMLDAYRSFSYDGFNLRGKVKAAMR